MVDVTNLVTTMIAGAIGGAIVGAAGFWIGYRQGAAAMRKIMEGDIRALIDGIVSAGNAKVESATLAPGSVTSPRVAPGAVPSPRVAPGAVWNPIKSGADWNDDIKKPH